MSHTDASPSSRPTAAVITVSYGSGDALEVFLRSLREFHGDALQVVVVDNKPDEENVEALASRFGAEYVALPDNPGYGAGMNAGVARLTDPVDAYFFCNPDVRFVSEAVHTLATELVSDGHLGSIGPRLFNEDGTVYPSARNIPSVATGVGHALLGRVWKSNPWTRSYQDASHYDRPRSAGWLSGAAVMVRADVYREIGGWDEAYFMHFEDIDLGYRIGLAGYENRFQPGISVEHSGAHSTKKHAAAVEKAMTASAIRFMEKRYPHPWQAPLRFMINAGLKLRGSVRLRSVRASGT